MGTKSIWGWGGIRFVQNGKDVTLNTSFGMLRFDPVKKSLEFQDGSERDKQRGWRAYLNVDLVNYDDGDSDKVVTLISILNTGGNILIYPKYETPDLGQNWSAQFKLDSSVSLDDIAQNLFVGQTARLAFKGTVLLSSIPDNTSDTELTYRCYDSEDNTSIRLYDSTEPTARRKTQ